MTIKQVNVEELASRDPTSEELESMCHELLFLRSFFRVTEEALSGSDFIRHYIDEEYEGEVPEEYQQE